MADRSHNISMITLNVNNLRISIKRQIGTMDKIKLPNYMVSTRTHFTYSNTGSLKVKTDK